MKRVKCSELQAGMVVREDVFGRNGEVVLSVGVQLMEKHIKLLEGWGVSSVAVEGQEEGVEGKFSPEQIAEAEKEIQSKFVDQAKEIPFVAQLTKLCVQRRLKQKYAQPAQGTGEAKPAEAKPVEAQSAETKPA